MTDTISNEQSETALTPFKSDDPGFLVAKGRFRGKNDDDIRQHEREHVKSLASAIFMAMTNHGYANIRSVGRNAAYNANKAIAIASGHCKVKGIDVCYEIVFDEGNLGPIRNNDHVKSVTALLFKLKGFREWQNGDQSNE